MLTDSFSAIAHLQKAPITASSEKVPNSQSCPHRRKYYLLFKQNGLIRYQRQSYDVGNIDYTK